MTLQILQWALAHLCVWSPYKHIQHTQWTTHTRTHSYTHVHKAAREMSDRFV